MPPTARPLEERFWEKVDASGDCWEWTASCQPSGYGQISIGHDGTLLAHRVAWELLVSPIPIGMQLDHLCRNKRCVNPDHLEPVTWQENLRRGAPGAADQLRGRTHCKWGHSLEDAPVRDRGNKRERVCLTM